MKKHPDIIMVDRSLFDRLIWVNRLYLKQGIEEEEYTEYNDYYTQIIKEKIDIVISTYTDSITALKRDYTAHLSLEKRSFLNEDNLNEYNVSLLNMKSLAEKEKINFYLFDTTNKNQRSISFENGNTFSDDFIAGSPVKVYSGLGSFLSVIESKWGFLFIVLVPCFLIFIYEIYALIVEVKYGDEEE